MEAAVHAVVVSVGAELLRSGAGGPLWSELESGGLRRSWVSRVGREGGRNLLIVAVGCGFRRARVVYCMVFCLVLLC